MLFRERKILSIIEVEAPLTFEVNEVGGMFKVA